MKLLPTWIFKARLWGTAYLFWFAVLFVLSSFSMNKKTVDLPTYSDKVAHFAYFACGSFALAFWLWLKFPQQRKLVAATLVIVAAAAVGLFDEWHQTFTVGRSGLDLGDWIADVCGGVAGWIAALTIRKRLPIAGRALSA